MRIIVLLAFFIHPVKIRYAFISVIVHRLHRAVAMQDASDVLSKFADRGKRIHEKERVQIKSAVKIRGHKPRRIVLEKRIDTKNPVVAQMIFNDRVGEWTIGSFRTISMNRIPRFYFPIRALPILREHVGAAGENRFEQSDFLLRRQFVRHTSTTRKLQIALYFLRQNLFKVPQMHRVAGG